MLAVAAVAFATHAQAESEGNAGEESPSVLDARSPWLLTPILSANPKLGTSFGALAGYLHYFDEKSRPSIFALSGQYTSTDSSVGGVYGRMSFNEDTQRLIAGVVYGNIHNDYDDYLSTGVPLKNEADLNAVAVRYTYRVGGDWFIGAQGIDQNFIVNGDTAFDDEVMNVLGIQPYESAGLGVVVQNDSRDNENMPTRGWLLNLNNLAFRESLGGEDDYDVYRLDMRYFIPHGKGSVFAMRQMNQWADDAPAAARAPVQLRGYKRGQYTGDYMSSIEAEERYRLGERWTTTIFAGIACLYGGGEDCSDSTNLFPSGGVGVQYLLKPKEGIVLNLEYAQGEGDNYGVYLKMGYGY